MPDSALIVEVPEAEPVIGALRLVHDGSAAKGVPAHVTALYPFLPPTALTDAIVDRLAAVASEIDAFPYVLTEIRCFDDAQWLRPEPGERFRSLTEALWRAFPSCPPYGGEHPDIVPHLSVASRRDVGTDAALRERIEAVVAPRLPLACRATDLSVFEEGEDGLWRRRIRLPLGGRRRTG